MSQQLDAFLRAQMQGKYLHMDMARQDIMNAVSHYKDLSPMLDNFVYNDGSRKSLLCLKGTIPVSYKGTRYNIPVAFWLQEAHPQVPPLCFVQPTNTMQVRQGKHVDSNGRIYLPYLTDWRQGSHSLTGCVQVMSVVFGEEPPVFAKPTRPPAPQSFPHQQQRAPYPSPGFSPQGPPTTSYHPNFRQPTPYPPSTTQQPPYPSNNSALGYPPYPGFAQPNQRHPAPTPSFAPQSQQQKPKELTIDDSMIKASLLTAVNDKLKRRLEDTLVQAENEVISLKKVETELKTGQEKILSILNELNKEVDGANENMVSIQERNERLILEIEKLQSKQDNLDVDDVVTATSPVYKQIVLSFAEEQALEDTMYYLGEALHKDVIDTDLFLKHVRALSRQQFLLRAVIQKARKSAGLPCVY